LREDGSDFNNFVDFNESKNLILIEMFCESPFCDREKSVILFSKYFPTIMNFHQSEQTSYDLGYLRILKHNARLKRNTLREI
jgi:hypothetical protein